MSMPAADIAPVAALQPDPPRPVPEHVGRVLGLLHAFIAYGRKLAGTLRQHAADPHAFPGFAAVTISFRTRDLTLIFDRITRGLLRAAALEARLNRLAARGRDLTPSPIRMPASHESAASIDDQPDDLVQEPDLAPPTPDDIIARDNRRPIGAVLVDICHDLGIMPGDMDRITWDELRHYIIGYGGSLVTYLFKRPPGPETPGVFQGYFTGPIPTAIAFAPWPALQFPVTDATGPP